MGNKKDNRLIILVASAIGLIVLAIILVIAFSSNSENTSGGEPNIFMEEKSYDFGTISMADGLAIHRFLIRNDGNAPLEISNMKTSCMCTTAVLDYDGRKSPVFGMHNNPAFWSEKLPAGEQGFIEVIFDPNAHGPDATGPINRNVTVTTNTSQNLVLTITADVVK